MVRDSRSVAADAGAPSSDFSQRRSQLRADPNRRLVLIEVNTNPAMSLGNQSAFLFVGSCVLRMAYINADNSVLANLLPGVIDSTLELVLASQLAENGVDCGVARRSQYISDLPGRFRLLVDDAAGYEYSGEGVLGPAAPIASSPAKDATVHASASGTAPAEATGTNI